MKPYAIGIAGPSCSGKTVLAAQLAQALPGTVAVVSLDAYYRDLSGLSSVQRAQTNFDAPDALDVDLLTRQMARLAQGDEVDSPVYDLKTHTRAARTERVAPGDFVIVEGLFALYWPAIRDLLATKVFVAADDALCLVRRERRDVRERGRAPDSVQAQYAETVRPMSERYVKPTRQHADVVVHGEQDVATSVAAVLEHVRRKTPHP